MVIYMRPRDVGDALRMLGDAGENGRVLVGGTDVLVRVRRRPLHAITLVDLKTASDLPSRLDISDDTVTFGPTATMSDLARDRRIAAWFPALVAAAQVVGSVAIRNRASLVGNICNASPAADTAPALLVYGAVVSIAGPTGTRTVSLADFFTGPGVTVCDPGDIVIGISLPIPAAGQRSAFQRLTRRRGVDLATVSAALGISPDGTVSLGLGAVGPTPLLAVSDPLGSSADIEEVSRTVERLAAVATPISDIRASSDYRRAMTAVLAQRAAHAAMEQTA